MTPICTGVCRAMILPGYEIERVPVERSMPAAPESSRGEDDKGSYMRTVFAGTVQQSPVAQRHIAIGRKPHPTTTIHRSCAMLAFPASPRTFLTGARCGHAKVDI